MSSSLAALKQEIKSLADPERAAHSQRYFKTGKGEYGEGDIFWGLRVPQTRQLAKQYATLDLSDIQTLIQSPYHEERLLAVILLVNRFKKTDDKIQKALYNFYFKNLKYINNWDIVDSSAPTIVGGYLYMRDRAPLYTLIKKKDLWAKRVAVMATLYFIQKQDFTDTLVFAEKLFTEQHDLLHKAGGWMLREIGNRNREVEEQFLKKHYQQMPRTMLRYAIEKFTEARRQAYLKGNI